MTNSIAESKKKSIQNESQFTGVCVCVRAYCWAKRRGWEHELEYISWY